MRKLSLLLMLIGCNSNKGDSGLILNLNQDTSKPDSPDGPQEVDDVPEPGDNPDSGDSGDPNNSGDETTDDDGDGLSEEQGDCNDSDNQIYQGAVDFPNDGIDQDCSGSDAILLDVLGGLLNPSFDDEDPNNPGIPNAWLNLGGAYSLQLDNANIFNINGDTGELFNSHTPEGAALKLWGDYGNNTISSGSHVYQEFAETTDWSPAGQIFWLDAWGYHHAIDPMLATSEASGWIKCFDDSYTLDGESSTQKIEATTQQSSWRRLSTWVHCGLDTTVVQVVLSFHQTDINTDHGVVYFDDIVFGESQ
jgi:hypothetical protein